MDKLRTHVEETLRRAHESLGSGRYSQAEKMFVRVLSRLDSPPADPYLESCYIVSARALGDLKRMRGQYDQARSQLESSLLRCETRLGKAHIQTALCLNSLGVLCKYQGKFSEGLGYYRRGLKVVSKFTAPHPEILATLFHNLGGIYFSRGEYARGEPYARRSVALRKKALGRRHPAVAADISALAALVEGRGRLKEAERMYRESIAIFRRQTSNPRYCYDLAINLNNLAAICSETGRASQAQGYYAQALSLQKKLWGGFHPDIALIHNNLGMLHWRCGDPRSGKRHLKMALKIFKAIPGLHSKEYAACLENLRKVLKTPFSPKA